MLDAQKPMYVGLEVTFTEWQHKPSEVAWRFAGPYSTPGTAKAQVKEYKEYKVWESDRGYAYGHPASRGPSDPNHREGRRRVDRIVLTATASWNPV